MSDFTIELKELNFYSFHGVYEEEKIIGGEFIVDLSVRLNSENKKINSINDTINYAALFEIIKAEMSQPREILETIAQTTVEKIHLAFPQSKEIEIRIEKKNPPIINFLGSVAIKYSKQF